MAFERTSHPQPHYAEATRGTPPEERPPLARLLEPDQMRSK